MKILALVILFLSCASWAKAGAPYPCDFEGISSVETALYPGGSSSNTFTYKYQVVGKLDPNDLVIIVIPGGPGGSAINNYDHPLVKKKRLDQGLPENIPWIMIDPRTVGCNYGDETAFPDDSLTSEFLAHDILSVIEKLNLKKYVLYGHSYGSQGATFVGGLAKERGLPAPHAVFLSGILGRGEKDGSFAIPHNLILEWEKLKLLLSPKVIELLEAGDPLGVEDGEWSGLLHRGLYDGFYDVNGTLQNPLIEALRLLDSEREEDREKLLKILRHEKKPRIGYAHYSDRLFAKVDCHEFSPADGNVNYSKGVFTFDEENDPCKNEAFDRPYDSKSFQIDAPIYYLAGNADPAAPYAGARYHFDNQSTRRNFMTVNGGGHVYLGWIFPDCKMEIWETIFERKDLDQVLKSCRNSVTLEIR